MLYPTPHTHPPTKNYHDNSWISVAPVIFHLHGFTIIPAWISNHMPIKVWDEITYPFPNFNGCTIKICEWNFFPHFIMDVIFYPCWDLSKSMLVKVAPDNEWHIFISQSLQQAYENVWWLLFSNNVTGYFWVLPILVHILPLVCL